MMIRELMMASIIMMTVALSLTTITYTDSDNGCDNDATK